MKKIFNFLVYILRYYSFLQVNYNQLSHNINFGSKIANKFFIKNLNKCKYYLEYGSGNSTFLSKRLKKKYLSVECDKSFFNFLRKKKINNVIYSNIGPTKYYSIPIIPTIFLRSKVIKYANKIELFKKKYKTIPDLILIDGRFRIYVALKVIKYFIENIYIKNITLIIDDFKYRKDYHNLKKIIKIKLVGRLAVIHLDKKTRIKINKIEVLKNKFILDYN